MRPLHSFLPLILFAMILFTSCASNEIGDSKDVAQDKIYQSYFINYTEGNASAAVECQFRFAGRNGTTLVLNSPSQVTLDGEILKVDSSKGGGAMYPAQKGATGFFGKHNFAFTTTDNKTYTNSFSFSPFKLVNLPSSASKAQPLNINFETEALQSDDYIELETTNSDSSFTVRHTSADAGNAILIPAKLLKKQTGKQLSLQATIYRSPALQQTTNEGGRMEMKYELKPVTIVLN